MMFITANVFVNEEKKKKKTNRFLKYRPAQFLKLMFICFTIDLVSNHRFFFVLLQVS